MNVICLGIFHGNNDKYVISEKDHFQISTVWTFRMKDKKNLHKISGFALLSQFAWNMQFFLLCINLHETCNFALLYQFAWNMQFFSFVSICMKHLVLPFCINLLEICSFVISYQSFFSIFFLFTGEFLNFWSWWVTVFGIYFFY